MASLPETPAILPVRVACPECRQALVVELQVTAQLVEETDLDGIHRKTLKAKVKSNKLVHTCYQMTVDDAVEASELDVMSAAMDEAARRINAGELGPDVTASTARVKP